MKKYLTIFAVLFTVILSSCSNEDIPVSQSTTFTINPTSVIEPLLECEIVAGELETLPSGFGLHVQLFIYNSNGELIQHEEETLPNYTSLMKREVYLPSGDYRALAITDVKASTTDYWEFENMDNLSGATIKSRDKLGYQWKILGLQSAHFTVEDGQAKDFRMTPTAYGALFTVGYQNIHAYSDVVNLGLAANRSADKLVFNSVGNPTLTVESNNNEFNWWNNYITVAEESDSFVYRYSFQLPISKYSLEFEAETTDSYITLSNQWTLDLKAGDGFIFLINLNDDGEITTQASQVAGSRANTDFPILENIRNSAAPNSVNLSAIQSVELRNYKR